MPTEPTQADPPKRKRRWFQFSLRTLLIVTLIVALPCAWLGHKIEQKRKEQAAVEAIVKLGGSVAYDYELIQGAKPTGYDWLRNLLGKNFLSDPVIVSFSDNAFVNDAGLVNLQALPQLQEVDLSYALLTDAGLENLQGLNKLRTLRLLGTKITDAGLVNLKGLTQLQELQLDGSNVGGAGLVILKCLAHLRWLSLSGTRTTDVGLANLKGLSQLQRLVLSNSKITVAGVKDLQKALPNCKIVY